MRNRTVPSPSALVPTPRWVQTKLAEISSNRVQMPYGTISLPPALLPNSSISASTAKFLYPHIWSELRHHLIREVLQAATYGVLVKTGRWNDEARDAQILVAVHRVDVGNRAPRGNFDGIGIAPNPRAFVTQHGE